jgi:hypothetical protein
MPLSVPSVSRPGRTLRSATARSMTAVTSAARAAQIARPGRYLAGAAVDRGVEVAPAVLGDPDRCHVEVPELVGTGDLEVARPPAAALGALGCGSPCSRISRCTRLRLTPILSSRPASAATMRVPSVGFSCASPSTTRSTSPSWRRWPFGGRLGGGKSPVG